jgi:hypothetical protein
MKTKKIMHEDLLSDFRDVLHDIQYGVFKLREKNILRINAVLDEEFKKPFKKFFDEQSKEEFVRIIFPKVEPGKFATPVSWFARVPKRLRDESGFETEMTTVRLGLNKNGSPDLKGTPNVPDELKKLIKNTMDKLAPYMKISEDLKKMGLSINHAAGRIGISPKEVGPTELEEELMKSGVNYTCRYCVNDFFEANAQTERIMKDAGLEEDEDDKVGLQ